MRRLLSALVITAALMLCPAALAGEAENITAHARLTSPKNEFGVKRLVDGGTDRVWKSRQQRTPYIEIKLPDDKKCCHLSIQWGEINPSWEIQTYENSKWARHIKGDPNYYTTYTRLDGLTRFRIAAPGRTESRLVINEITLFGEGEKPEYVQEWRPTHVKADLLLLVAHPDDEFVFMGGVIPYYAVQRGKKVVVAYLTESTYQRRSELLNGLWAVGLRNYPVMGKFHDRFSYVMKEAYEKLGEKRLKSYAVELLRRFKPEVAVTHDIEGEYGHAVHKVCADMMIYALPLAGDIDRHAESADLGPWDAPKAYLHLYPENALRLDFLAPLSAFGGKSALDVARVGFSHHISQQNTPYTVYDGGPYDSALFGLYRSLVGPDIKKDDFFENLPDDARDYQVSPM